MKSLSGQVMYSVRGLLLLLFVFVASCAESHPMGDAGGAMDALLASAGDSDVASGDVGSGDVGSDASAHSVVCSGRECANGEACCLTSGECFDPSVAGACVRDPRIPEGCASSVDCEPGEICYLESGGCRGVGVCLRPPSCGGRDPAACGCDGRTYENRCAAFAVGVQVSRAEGACGSRTPPPLRDPRPTPCGTDGDCPGSSCCFFTGTCVPLDCPECCFPSPPGHIWPCATDQYCVENLGEGAYCNADACDGPGACRWRSGPCSGSLAPVCGCDGVTYSNQCWLEHAGSRRAHEGECVGG